MALPPSLAISAGLFLLLPVSAAWSSPANAETDQAAGAEALPTVPVAAAESENGAAAGISKKSANRLVEEIIVTAQRREENLQTVPISISAFSGDSLETLGVVDPKGLGKITPSLQFTEQYGSLFAYIRGIGSDAFIPAVDPAVTTYLDGVAMTAAQGAALAFGGVERVEVLKGPQGTLFGVNSTGGAISIVTKQPGDTLKGSLQAEVGNFGNRRLKVYTSFPLTDWLGISADLLIGSVDPAYSNINYEIPNHTNSAGRVSATVKPLDELSINLTYLLSKTSDAGSTIQKNIHPSPVLGAPLPTEADNYTATTDYPADNRTDFDIFYGIVEYQWPGFETKLIVSDQSVEQRQAVDYEGSSVPLVGASDLVLQDSQSAELQFLSNADSWGHEYFEWVFGSYYRKNTGGYDPFILRAAPDLLVSIFPPDVRSRLPAAALALLDAIELPNSPIGSDGVEIPVHGTSGTKSWSGFGQTTIFLQDWLNLTLGGRYQTEKRYLIKASSNLVVPLTGEEATLFDFDKKSSTVNNFSPKAVLSLTLDPILVYASWTKGFKSATYNIVNIYSPPDYVKPEEITSYELGIKAQLFDNTLRVNAAIFQNTIDNLQSLYVSLLAGGAVRLENAGQARIRGFDGDMVWTPMPDLNPELVLVANASILDPVYTDYRNGSGFDPVTGLSQSNLDFTGNQIARTPKYTFGLGAVQTLDAGENGEIELAVDGYRNGGFYYTAQNVDFVKEDPYTLIDARASYRYRPFDAKITVYGSNLLDTKYHVSQTFNDFGNNVTLAYPRQFGLRITKNF